MAWAAPATDISCLSSGGEKNEIRVSTGMVPHEDCEGEFCRLPLLLVVFWQSLVSLAYRSFPSLGAPPSHGILPACRSASTLPFLPGTCHMGLGPTLMSYLN